MGFTIVRLVSFITINTREIATKNLESLIGAPFPQKDCRAHQHVQCTKVLIWGKWSQPVSCWSNWGPGKTDRYWECLFGQLSHETTFRICVCRKLPSKILRLDRCGFGIFLNCYLSFEADLGINVVKRFFTPKFVFWFAPLDWVRRFQIVSSFILSVDMSKSYPIYTVDAFTEKPYAGNPAAVCLTLDDKLEDEQYLKISSEMNLSETAFVSNHLEHSKDNPIFNLRWFTPKNEVNLCGTRQNK